MKYIEAFSEEVPNEYIPTAEDISIFLGGGISNCANWQRELTDLLEIYHSRQYDKWSDCFENLVLINPRRKNYPENDPHVVEQQILWEHRHLQRATGIVFWFAKETLCPITLFEYGKWLMSNRPLFVGCDPEYKRILDVQVQTKLERPFQKVFTSIEEIAGSIILGQGIS